MGSRKWRRVFKLPPASLAQKTRHSPDPLPALLQKRPSLRGTENHTHVRQLLDYDRLEHHELVDGLNALLKLWSR
ncbi:MAG: hypothetical protein RL117_474 [Verrucomicrobiota bacterium]